MSQRHYGKWQPPVPGMETIREVFIAGENSSTMHRGSPGLATVMAQVKGLAARPGLAMKILQAQN